MPQIQSIRLLAASVLLLCPVLTVSAEERIAIGGASTVQPIIEKAAPLFTKAHPEVQFVIGGGGSDKGVSGAASGELAIGMCSRDLRPDEVQKYPDLVATLVGRDGVAMIVSADNPVQGLSKKQIQDIYTGVITNWKQVGGKDEAIILVSKEHGRSTLDLFLHYAGLEAKEQGEGEAQRMIHRIKSKAGDTPWGTAQAKIIGANNAAIASVSTSTAVLAYVSVGNAESVASKTGDIKLLALDGATASSKAVAAGAYPLGRTLNVLTKGPATGNAKAFIDFLLSADGQRVVAELDYIPVVNR
jgi:phosphate transport system substrate-binding protein